MASYFCLSWNPFSIQNPLKNISLTNIISLPTLQVHSTYNFLPYYALFLAYIHYLSSWAKCKLYTRRDCFVFYYYYYCPLIAIISKRTRCIISTNKFDEWINRKCIYEGAFTFYLVWINQQLISECFFSFLLLCCIYLV